MSAIFNNKILSILILTIAFLASGSAIAWTGGEDKIFIDPSEETKMWSIYVYGVGDVVKEVLIATKMLTTSDDFITFTMVVILIGLFITASRFAVEMDGRRIVGFFFGIVFFSYALVGAKVDVVVSDQYNHSGGPQNYVVQDVPAVVGLPISFITTGINKLQVLFSQALSMPGGGINYSDYSVAGKGFNFLGSIVKDSQSIQITNPNVKASFEEYFAQCVMYEQYNGSLVGVDLLSTNDILADIEVDIESRFARYYDATTGAVTLETCKDIYANIKTIMEDSGIVGEFINSSMSGYKFANLGITPTNAIASAYSALGATGTGTNIASQNAIINTITGAYEHASTITGAEEIALAINTEQAKKAQTTGWLTGAEVFSDMVLYLLGGLQALVFAMMPLLVAFVAIPGMGMQLVVSVLKIILWLSLWPLGLEVVNFLAVHVQVHTYSQNIVGSNGVTFSTSIGMSESTAKMTMVFSLVATIMPMLLYSLINKGEFSLTEAMSKGLGADQGKAAGAAAAKGDVSYDNWKSNSVAASQYNTAFSNAMGDMGTTVHANNGLASIKANVGQSFQVTAHDQQINSSKQSDSERVSENSKLSENVSVTSGKVFARVDGMASSRVQSVTDSEIDGDSWSKSIAASDLWAKNQDFSKNVQTTVGRNKNAKTGKETRAAERMAFSRQVGANLSTLGIFRKSGSKNGINMDEVKKLEDSDPTKAALTRAHQSGTGLAGAATAIAMRSQMGAAIEDINNTEGLSDEEKLARISATQSNLAAAASGELAKSQGYVSEDGKLTYASGDKKGQELSQEDKSNFIEKTDKAVSGWINDFKQDWDKSDTMGKAGMVAMTASTALMFTGAGAILGGALRGASLGFKAFEASNSKAAIGVINAMNNENKVPEIKSLKKKTNEQKGYENRNQEGAVTPPPQKETKGAKALRFLRKATEVGYLTGAARGSIDNEVTDSASVQENDGYDFNLGTGNASNEAASKGNSVNESKTRVENVQQLMQYVEANGFTESLTTSETDNWSSLKGRVTELSKSVDRASAREKGVGVNYTAAASPDAAAAFANGLKGQPVTTVDPNTVKVVSDATKDIPKVPDESPIDLNEAERTKEAELAKRVADTAAQREDFTPDGKPTKGEFNKAALNNGDDIYNAIVSANQGDFEALRNGTERGGTSGFLKKHIGDVKLPTVDGQALKDEAMVKLNNNISFHGLSDGEVVEGSFAMMGKDSSGADMPIVRFGEGENGRFGTYNPETQKFTALSNEEVSRNFQGASEGSVEHESFKHEAEKVNLSDDALKQMKNGATVNLDGAMPDSSGQAADEVSNHVSRDGVSMNYSQDKGFSEKASGVSAEVDSNGKFVSAPSPQPEGHNQNASEVKGANDALGKPHDKPVEPTQKAKELSESTGLPILSSGELEKGESAISANGLQVENLDGSVVEAGSNKAVTLNSSGEALVSPSVTVGSNGVSTDVLSGAGDRLQAEMQNVDKNLTAGANESPTQVKNDDVIAPEGTTFISSNNIDIVSQGDGVYTDMKTQEEGELNHVGQFTPYVK